MIIVSSLRKLRNDVGFNRLSNGKFIKYSY